MRLFASSVACLLCLPAPLAPQGLDAETLGLIEATAAGICGEFSREGSASSAAIEGAAEARLKGLAGQLDARDIAGTATLGETGYLGVLREELGGELKDIRTCRLKVFGQLLATVAVPGPPQDQPETGELLRPWCSASRLNPTERAICANRRLARLDAELEAAYGQARAPAGDSEQAAWLSRRNACGTDPSCIARLYGERLAELR
ncbi:lysozyme inhibitor LprI family protein [Poseidonocella sp. HB161398]|uniref:lysozyme inhibitor LprI family protein n=1 Tax=Poseidonocella sp. HB161398 TaxID=2320855 RepID=UPI0014866D07|nr:lysozyme inhibitor LprI family protein [Poseidonocella sp. HB161398]